MSKAHDHVLLERLTFFSDAVFAIAMTLLVIDVKLPVGIVSTDRALVQILLNLLPNYIAFVSSFLVIARFWVGHHQLFGMLETSDNRLLWANLFLLLVVAFMPFPTAVLSEYVQLRVGMCFYGAWLVVIGAMQVIVTRAALAGRRLVRADVPDAALRERRAGSWIPVLIGVSTIAVALLEPLLGLVTLSFGASLYGRVLRRLANRGWFRPG